MAKRANAELIEALALLEKEKSIKRETIIEAIQNALVIACKSHFGRSDNINVVMDPETCEYKVLAAKEVVEDVLDPLEEISLDEAREIDSSFQVGDTVHIPVESQNFGRIATSAAKNVILQKIREEERSVIFSEYSQKEHQLITGVVQRYIGKNISINLGKVDAILSENEQIKTEHYEPTDRIKVYILDVHETQKGARVRVSRTHPELIRRLFEEEVAEVRDGTVEIKAIAREAGNRTKIAVASNDPNVDAVGACVGMNGSRVNAVVAELGEEKIDIIEWNENAAMLIENALSPAKVIAVVADSEEKTARVVVPDYQLSLAIGREGQNARLAARLTGFKIDIKSETQAREAGDFMDYDEEVDGSFGETYEDLDDIDAEYGGADDIDAGYGGADAVDAGYGGGADGVDAAFDVAEDDGVRPETYGDRDPVDLDDAAYEDSVPVQQNAVEAAAGSAEDIAEPAAAGSLSPVPGLSETAAALLEMEILDTPS